MLTPEQIVRYHSDGFLALPDFKSSAELAALRLRAMQMVDDFDPESSKTIFTTNDQIRTVDRYFLDSATPCTIWTRCLTPFHAARP